MLPVTVVVPAAVAMIRRFFPNQVRDWTTKVGLAAAMVVSAARGQEANVEQAIGKQIESIKTSFDKGDAGALANLFMAEGEMINEEGTVYRGREELKGLFQEFFTKFPGATLAIAAESVRSIGPSLVVEEGSRKVTTVDGQSRAELRYIAVWSLIDKKWLIASIREVADDAPLTHHALLESLSWLIGEWVNEGDDAAVKITYQWSEDGNFILADYDVVTAGKRSTKSTQRIGWDPTQRRFRSWLFDADGGFSEGLWTPTETGWLISSSAVLPTGETGSAMLQILPADANRFTIKGTNRLIAGVLDSDFEVIVTKRPSAGINKEDTRESK
ncbi:SgcJ/EcaC family oxidoreductase [bacterium]|nr:SgcJ/EcaC family oxidoreductase [bacterium]